MIENTKTPYERIYLSPEDKEETEACCLAEEEPGLQQLLIKLIS